MNTLAEDKKAVFETMTVSRALAIMALPTVISQIIGLIYNISDAWFLGQTNNAYMVGASSLVMVYFLTMVALGNLFGVGGGNLVSRQLGAGDMEGARKTISYSIVRAALVGLVFSIICFVFMDPMLTALGASENTIEYARQYTLYAAVFGGIPTVLCCCMPNLMRNVGYAREAAIGVAMGSIINIALDPLLMFVILPDGYQVLAAGLATMLAYVIELIYFIVMYRKLESTSVLTLPKGLVKLEPEAKKSLYSVGIPAAVLLILFNSLNVVFNRIAATSYGDITLAAVGIVTKLERLPQNVGMGVCLGMVPLIAYNYASKNFERSHKVFSAARITILVLGLFTTALFCLFPAPIMSAFLDNQEAIEVGTAFMQARALSIPFMLLNFHVFYYLQAIDQGKFAFLSTLIRHVVLSIPFMIIFNNVFGIEGLMWSQTAADVIGAILAYLIYFYVQKKVLVKDTE